IQVLEAAPTRESTEATTYDTTTPTTSLNILRSINILGPTTYQPSEPLNVEVVVLGPGPVGNVTIRDIESTAINVTWTIPEINPDPTNYIAVAWSMIPRQEHTARCEVEAPGKPTSFNVIKFTDLKNTCDATKINVTWSEPNLQDRNANITRYVVMRELPPPKMDSHIEKLEITSSSVIFNLDPNFFKNEIQGKIVKYGMWKKQLLREGEEYEEQETLQEIVEPNRSIPIATYNEALADLHRDTHLILAAQYEEIKRRADQIGLKAAFAAAKLDPNKSKNRWANILPFDHSRGFHYQREYIATQGPLPGTIDDFWRMVWEQNVMMIVMLTQCKEGNKVKCEMYWPDTVKEPKQYGNVVVNPTSITNMNKFNINIFDISHATDVTKIRKVLQFHYLDFMDFTAAVEVDNFIEFVRTVRGHVPHEMTSPMVIHCSAGVGRTGSYIAIDRLQEYLNSPTFSFDDRINIFDMVMEMREQRVNMVQTESQYILIHDCFERMLEDKKTSLQTTQTMAKLAYGNIVFYISKEQRSEWQLTQI
ncbi:PTPRB-like protein, partial [Mya arenaria]